MLVETHWLPKSGHAADEYEDAFGASDPGSFPFRAAVADGATESAFSGKWARTLVGEYLKLGDLVESAASARTLFAPPPDGRWYVQAKAAEGAHAALLGVQIDDGEGDIVGGAAGEGGVAEEAAGEGDVTEGGAGEGDVTQGAGGDEGVAEEAAGEGDAAEKHQGDESVDAAYSGRWRAESVGDCCLFHVRGGSLVRSWPYAEAADFHHRPALVSSLDPAADVEATSGTWVDGDTIVLATDALAAWLLEVGVDVLLATDDFEALAASARRGAGADATTGTDSYTGARLHSPQPLRNDDSTAMIIRL